MNAKISGVKFIRFPRLAGDKSHPHETVWPLSAAISATILKQQGLKSEVLDLAAGDVFGLGEAAEKISQDSPDVLFMQFETPSLNTALDFARKIKGLKNDLVIVGFGQHASALPLEIMGCASVDACICTDPELIIKDLIPAIENKQLSRIGNIVFRSDDNQIITTGTEYPACDIDSLPYVDLSLISPGAYRKKKFPKPFFWGRDWGFIRTSLGCPNRCIFCSSLLRHSISKQYKLHSIAYVTGQIRFYKEKFGIKVFSMEDDSFCIDEERTFKLCEAVSSLKIRWVADGVRADKLSLKLLKAMKRSGCFGVGLGIESGSQKILDVLNKGESRERIKEAALDVKRSGMLLAGYVMIGNPSETEADLAETIRLINEIKPHILYIHYFMPYPGCDAYYLLKQKIDIKDMTHYKYSGINFSNIESAKLNNLMSDFYKRYYFSWPYIKEYLKHRFIYSVCDLNEISLIKEALGFIGLRR
ncbi:MAG: radical SAM protein [Candidatus Omnitrophica bacterium]|nr:radical SAM protein [Candidatus Omnitrophota bacterium]